MGLRLSSWRTALIAIVVIKAVLSLAVKPGSFLVSYSGISYFLLLTLATVFSLRNGIQNTLGSRTFWSFLATGFGLWSLNQFVQLHYELGLHVAVPQDSIADTLLFLHVVALMTVVTVLPRRDGAKPRLARAALESFFLLLVWVSLYAFAVFPYQYLYSTSSYGVRFDILYLAANLSLVLAAGILALRLETPWKRVCLHLFGASVVYTIGSAVANLAIDTGGYVSGKLYGLCLTAAACWFVWIPLQAREEARADATTTISDDGRARPSLWPMGVLVMISIPIGWELLRRNENPSFRALRLFVAIVIIVCFASVAYIAEYFSRHASLLESEQRFRMAAQAGKMYSFEWDVITDEVLRSPEHVEVLGSKRPLRSTHRQFVEEIHSGDRPQLTAAIAGLTPDKPTAEVIYRAQSSDGGFVWLRSSGRGFFDSHGKLVRVVGMVADITVLKQAEEALSGMTRKLVEAQEQERARIARELHDDISQRLALLAVNLTQLQENRADVPREVVTRMQELGQQTAEISADVHSLSHELHSSGLEYLGPVAGIKSWCGEFAEKQGMQIDFISSEVPSSVPSDVGLCLFRVLQEALHNAVKHSGVKRAEVQLLGKSGEIHLIVSDLGEGFDVVAGKEGRGLGLTSMQERVRLVNGVISIESKPMRGTTIHVRVPQAQTSSAASKGHD